MYMYANADVVVRWRNGKVRLHKGEAWDASDDFVKDRPEFFNKVPTIVKTSGAARPVEAATANPGERRRTKRAG